jgi:hypothetical protein
LYLTELEFFFKRRSSGAQAPSGAQAALKRQAGAQAALKRQTGAQASSILSPKNLKGISIECTYFSGRHISVEFT